MIVLLHIYTYILNIVSLKVWRLTFGNSNLQLPPQISYGITVWRPYGLETVMARPLQDLNVLLLEPLLCCLGRVFSVIVMLEYIYMYSFSRHFLSKVTSKGELYKNTRPRPIFNALAEGRFDGT